jgi:hypothetical protein
LSALAAAACALGAAPTALATHAPGGSLLPDLKTKEPERLSIVTSGNERRLRLDNEVGNGHNGPLELVAAAFDSDCDGDEVVGQGERVAFQRIYADGNSDGAFSRGIDGVLPDVQVGCFAYHAAHDHIHFADFAEYSLWRSTPSGYELAASSSKVTFCIADVRRFSSSLLGSPLDPYYTSCDGLEQGLSVGWSDEYPYWVAGQHVVINPGGSYVGDGDYCLVSTADPGSLLAETSDTNNAASLRLRLSGNGTRVKTYRRTSCAGVGAESW